MISQLKLKQMDEAYDFIYSYWEKEGMSPTIREVQEYLGVSSISTAYSVIRKLAETGRIETKPRCARAIKTAKTREPR